MPGAMRADLRSSGGRHEQKCPPDLRPRQASFRVFAVAADGPESILSVVGRILSDYVRKKRRPKRTEVFH